MCVCSHFCMSYLGAHRQCKAVLVCYNEDNDGLENGPQESVDPKHQGTQLLGER